MTIRQDQSPLHFTAMRRVVPAGLTYGRDNRENAIVTGLVMLMTLLGGGPATVPTPRFVAAVLAAIMAGVLLASVRNRRPLPFRFADGLVAGLVVLIIAQLVPLPASLWTALPGRALTMDIDMAVFGRLGWRPLSVDPSLTAETATQLLPALAAYIAVRTGPAARLVAVIDGVLIAGGLGLLLGALQMLFQGAAVLSPYSRGDYLVPTGFFTNHNHQAVFLECLFPLALIRTRLAPWTRRRLPADLKTVLGVSATGVLACVVLATGSRMGTALLVPLTITSWIALRGASKIGFLRAVTFTGGIAMLVALGGTRLVASLQKGDLASDQRWDFFRDAWQANLSYWPAGAGLGTFSIAFAPLEPLAHLGPHYLNHVHNDYLELAFEAGAAGMLLAGVGIIWFLSRMTIAYRDKAATDMQMLHRMACIPVLLLLLHSIFDYPLRTLASEIVMATSIALLSINYPPHFFKLHLKK
ncbi:O-antigen ligase family protein [Novosphingobium sp.]|uniref:O-antigen ligase family protein n=1 Tax=Novosphingobium sp. TaxID=1874826 RepID=UPI002610E0B1|nr:O-antigen ligase family protein [Novosphingobium sp.]